MNDIKKIKGLVIIGRKWRDKINGNTYHSAEVIIFTSDDIRSYKSGLTYGYGEQYLETAHQLLVDLGWLKDDKMMWESLKDADIDWTAREFYTLKKEL